MFSSCWQPRSIPRGERVYYILAYTLLCYIDGVTDFSKFEVGKMQGLSLSCLGG